VATVPVGAETGAGCVVIVGEGQFAESVTTPVVLLTPIVLQLFDTCTQYVVIVFVGVTVTEELVAPLIGFDVLPDVPWYH
jgi:hypothetical protein